MISLKSNESKPSRVRALFGQKDAEEIIGGDASKVGFYDYDIAPAANSAEEAIGGDTWETHLYDYYMTPCHSGPDNAADGGDV